MSSVGRDFISVFLRLAGITLLEKRLPLPVS